MNKSTSDSLKGIFAILVLLCHVCGQSGFCMIQGIGIGAVITSFGYWGVSVFLFLSGYGLMKRYAQRGGYLIDFQRNRVVSICVLNILLIILYAGEHYLLGLEIEQRTLVKSFLFGGTIVRNGWYIQMIILMYEAFYLSYRYIRSESGKILSVLAGTIVYIASCIIMDLGSVWYECMLCFPLGLVWAKEGKRIDSLLERRYLMTSAIVTLIFAGSFLLSVADITRNVHIPFKMLSSVSFVTMILVLLKKIPVQSKLTSFLGGYYMEIYVLQGLVLNVLQKYTECFTPFEHFSLAIVGSLLLAIVMKKPLAMVMGVVKCKK